MNREDPVLRLVEKQGDQIERIEQNTSRWGALKAYTTLLHLAGVFLMLVILIIGALMNAFIWFSYDQTRRDIELVQYEIKWLQQHHAVSAAIDETIAEREKVDK